MKDLILDPFYQMFYTLMACFFGLALFMLGEWIKNKFKKK